MQTPIYDYVRTYARADAVRLHMPGHKGRGIGGDWISAVYPLDITEIDGADSLYDAEGIIRESERNASELFATAATYYSAEGSSLAIRAMLALMKQERRTVIAVRNVHRSFLSACVLLGLNVRWVYPEYTGGILSGEISPKAVEAALEQVKGPACVYLTSPDYLGKCAHIAAIKTVCRRYDAPLLVDNAHGAHLAFFEPSRHPVALGADLCCDSAHKMLPALTGAAYLHIGNPDYVDRGKAAMALFGSTSPSYLILASLDLCNRYLEVQARPALKSALRRIKLLRERCAPFVFYPGEEFHLTICAAESGIDGRRLADLLKVQGIIPEYYDHEFVVLLCSPATNDVELGRLEEALIQLIPMLGKPVQPEPFRMPELITARSMRNAALGEYETISVEEASGRICAGVRVPCPPALPIAVSGEVIDDDCVNIFKRYGILRVDVVK